MYLSRKAPLLSICVPTFNEAEKLRETLRSLHFLELLHERECVEILVSNNASTDWTANLSGEINLPNMTWFNQEQNLGFKGNMEFLTNRASGDYVIFLGSGELVIANSFPSFVDQLKADSWTLGTVGTKYFDELLGTVSSPDHSSAVAKIARKILKPLYIEAISGNVFNRELLLDALGGESLTGNSWPHVEAALSMASEDNLRVFAFSNPLVIIHGSSDGWWRQPDQWKLTWEHFVLLARSPLRFKNFFIFIKYLELSSTSLYAAFSQSATLNGGPVLVNLAKFRPTKGFNVLVCLTILILLISGKISQRGESP